MDSSLSQELLRLTVDPNSETADPLVKRNIQVGVFRFQKENTMRLVRLFLSLLRGANI